MKFKDFIKVNLYQLPTTARPFAWLLLDSYTELGVVYPEHGICYNVAYAYLYTPTIEISRYQTTERLMYTLIHSYKCLPINCKTKWKGQQLTLRRNLLQHIIQQLCLEDTNTPANILQYMQQYKLKPIKGVARNET